MMCPGNQCLPKNVNIVCWLSSVVFISKFELTQFFKPQNCYRGVPSAGAIIRWFDLFFFSLPFVLFQICCKKTFIRILKIIFNFCFKVKGIYMKQFGCNLFH